ncbi:MAG: PAS domain S-box protein [Planctomycetaceae bacterium]
MYLQDPSSGEDLLKTLILAERDFLRYQDEFIGLISSELAYWAYSRDMQSLMYGMGAVCLIPLVVFLVNWHILRYLRRIYVRLLGRTQQLQRRTRDLWDSREQMRLLLENLPAAAYTCDSQGLITYYNQAAVGLWGRASPPQQYHGSLLWRSDRLTGRTEYQPRRLLGGGYGDQCCVHGEVVVETPQGHRRTVLTHASPLYNMNGDCTGIVTVLIDVSERMELERSLRATTAKLELCLRILDQHSIVAETDLSGVIRHVNDMFCRISGYSRGELYLRKAAAEDRSGYHPPGFWKGVFGTIAREGMWQGAIRNRRKNGEPYWVEATIAKMFDGNGVPCGYFAIHNDITELKSAKEQALAACRSKRVPG